MVRKDKIRAQKKPIQAKQDLEEFLKQLPPPPKEHSYELEMEKRLKRMLKKQEKKPQKRAEAS